MEWNWYFSSVPQSVAALVGILSAFLISRLLNNEAAYTRNRERTRDLLRQAGQLTDKAEARQFERFNERSLANGLHEVADAVKSEETTGTAEDYYERFNFSPYVPKQQVLNDIERLLMAQPEQRAGAKVHLPSLGPSLPSALTSTALTVAGRAALEVEREAIAQLVVSIKAHIKEVEEHLDTIRTQPERSRVVRITLVVILVLFWACVIYPLSFLPVASTGIHPSLSRFIAGIPSTRGLILLLATVFFTALIVYLGVLNERLVHPESDLHALESRLAVESYSKYLKVRVDNGISL